MQIWADVYDASGNRLGNGPITSLLQVSVNRVLDGAGTISFSTPATDPRALELLQVRRRVRLFADYAGQGIQELGRGIIMERRLNETPGSSSFSFTCADNLAALKDDNTLIGRAYSQQSLQTVAEDLIDLTTGWQVEVEEGTNDDPIADALLDARFDGASILKSLQQICKNNGLHLRLKAGANSVVQIGKFGDLSPIAITNAEGQGAEVNPNVMIVDNLQAGEDGEEIVNWVIALGAGNDAGSLKLKRATLSDPYEVIRGTTEAGKKYWYIKDDASIAQYGRVQRILNVKDIAPISNAPADKIAAANALYKSAAEYLKRASVPQKNYRVTLRGVRAVIQPGDKINIRYKGRVFRDGRAVDYADLNDDFWITKVSDSISGSGRVVSLTISNVDKTENTTANAVVEAMEDVEIQKVKPITAATCRTFVFTDDLNLYEPVTFPIYITDATLEVIRIVARIKTFPARFHRHLMFLDTGPVAAPVSGWRTGAYSGDASGGTAKIVNSGDGDGAYDIYSGYNQVVQNADNYPVNIHIAVNGVDKTNALGGPFSTTNGQIDIALDTGKMTKFIVNADGGEQQEHQIELSCELGQGRVRFIVEIYEIIQSIDLEVD